MRAIYEMTPEERLWAKKLTLLMVDAIDGPMSYQPSEFYMTEYEARRDAGDMIDNLHPTFVFCCDVVDADPYRIRERFIDGELDRDGLMRYYTMLNRD